MPNVKIALWDLGNVVVRWEPETILELCRCDAEQTDFLRREFLGHTDWLKLDQGLITEREFAGRLIEQSTLSRAQVLRCFDVVRESLTDLSPSIEMIQQMHNAGIPMYVLSNMSLDNASYLREREYFQYFDGVMISAEENLNKPDPELFKRLLNKFSLQAEDVYFIDDSQPNIETALSLGFSAQHFHRTPHCYQEIRRVFQLPDGG